MSETNKNRAGQRNTATSRSSTARKANADRIAAVKSARNTGSGQTARRSAGTNRRRKRRRQSPDFAKILLILIGIVIAVLCVAVGLKGCAKDSDEKTKSPQSTTEVPETEIHADITVNGISVNGLTKTEAMTKILADLNWGMTVSLNGETKPVDNLLYYCVDDVLEEAFGKGEAGSYELTFDGLKEHIAAEVENIAYEWDAAPVNGSINAFDKASGEFKFAEAQSGRAVDREALADAIAKTMDVKDYDAVIEVKVDEVAAEISAEQAKASFKRIGTYTTTTTNNKARNENVRIASEALHGMIIQPGEEFSFNLTTGNRTPEKGYQPAGAYVNGVLVEEPGGGVCQVSSTLYNAVVFAGLKTTERHAHSYEPSYVTPGEDAMVSYDGYSGPDMKFINNSNTAIGLKTSFANQKLTVSVYGSPILEEGVTLSMVSTKVKELDPPAPVYEEDQTLEPGVEVEAKAATMGSRWATSLVTKKDGVVISESHFHNSTYKGKSATIKRNTSGVVIPAPGTESTEASESSASEGVVTTEPSNTAGPGQNPHPTEAETTAAPTAAPAPEQPTSAPSSSLSQGQTPSSGATSGPGGNSPSTSVPQSPADMPGMGGGPSAVPTQGQSSGGPSGSMNQQAETSAGPGNVGLIAPIG